MNGPIVTVRNNDIAEFEHLSPIHEWSEGKAYLMVDLVRYRGEAGAVFTYHNPPVHQMGNPALDAYLAGFAKLDELEERLSFVILNSATDPVHAGGDLKESLGRLEQTYAAQREREAQGAAPAELDKLYRWADARIEKGFALYLAARRASERARTVAICGGGTRFGGSAEVPLMADHLVADSRAALCFSESQIGLIPGWGGVGRAVTKAGWENAYAMAATCAIVKAPRLLTAGLVDRVIPIDSPLPRKEKTGDPAADKQRYLDALQAEYQGPGKALLTAALELAVGAPPGPRGAPEALFAPDDVKAEVARRANPATYEGLWARPLREVADDIERLGKPLAPQSVEALQQLFAELPVASFDEEKFIRAEGNADGRLYRDPRLHKGIVATLEQRVADFREDS
jgi:enoyl-CoA hydratase/carnithine racemase